MPIKMSTKTVYCLKKLKLPVFEKKKKNVESEK